MLRGGQVFNVSVSTLLTFEFSLISFLRLKRVTGVGFESEESRQ